MNKRYTKESLVDIIYNNAKKLGYNEGFRDGYERGVQEAKEMIELLGGGE